VREYLAPFAASPRVVPFGACIRDCIARPFSKEEAMEWASVQVAIVLVLVVVVFFGFVRERMPPDIVALSAVGVLLVLGILGTADVLSVFSNPAPVTVAAMFVLSAALERTGVIDGMGRAVSRIAHWSPSLALLALLGFSTVLSAFINNTPVVVILTPVVFSLAKSLGQSASKMLIPLSFASIFGGTTTLIGTSTNILVDGVAQRQGLAPFGMFEITAAGAIMAAVGIAYLVLVGQRMLPDRDVLAELLPNPTERHFLGQALIPLGSPLVGKTLDQARLSEKHGFRVIDVIRDNASHRAELDGIELRAGDRLVVRSKIGDMLGLREAGDIAFDSRNGHAFEPIETSETVLMEGIVGPYSRLIGRRLTTLYYRRLYGAYILAVHRQGESLSQKFEDIRLQMGDTVLLEGPARSMRQLFDYRELVNLVQPSGRPIRRGKAPIAVTAVLLVMVLAALDVLPIAALALVAATAVVAFRCLDVEEAYGAIRWNILMLIFGMLALGVAMEKTGAARVIVENMAAIASGFGPIAVLAAVYIVTSLLTEIMSNNASAILLTPIAIGLALQLGVDPRPFAVAVMFAASASFATPIGYQTNTFVYNAGGYRFTDFVKVGLPLNLLFAVVAVFIIPVFWPL
jgi:di/tricarboxylate transporter